MGFPLPSFKRRYFRKEGKLYACNHNLNRQFRASHTLGEKGVLAQTGKFALADHMRSSLVIEALDQANTVRGGLDGAIFHSDHGSVYASAAFSTRCQELGVIQSMGAIGTSADNALAESFNSTMKREVLRNRKVFANPLQCRQEVFRWCIRYNTQRRHSWCGQISPDVFETQSITLTKAA